MPAGTCRIFGRCRTTAIMKSLWLTRLQQRPPDCRIVERRLDLVQPHAGHQAAGSVGSHSQVGRLRSSGSRSKVGASHQSNSPACIAAAAVVGIGQHVPLDAVEMHNLRPGGEFRRAGGARHIGGVALIGDLRAGDMLVGVEAERAAADHLRLTCLNASVLARRSGIIAQKLLPGLPSASGSSANGCFRRNWMVLSSGADSSSV